MHKRGPDKGKRKSRKTAWRFRRAEYLRGASSGWQISGEVVKLGVCPSKLLVMRQPDYSGEWAI